ncbi:putative leader peptide [Streptomyces clavuligerus]|nr:putative leader peptide [Streptomyces clavuligerus]
MTERLESPAGCAVRAPQPPLLLTSRRHIDLLRVSSAASPPR